MITANEARIITNENLDKAITRMILEEEAEKETEKEKVRLQNIINIARSALIDSLSKVIGKKIATRAANGYNSITISCGDHEYVSAPWYSDLFINARDYAESYREYRLGLNDGKYCHDDECYHVYDYTIFIRKIIVKILNDGNYEFNEKFHQGNNNYSNYIDFIISW